MRRWSAGWSAWRQVSASCRTPWKSCSARCLKGGPVEKWVGQIGEGLEKFAGYVGTPEFQESVRLFVDGIGKIGEKIADVVKWFGDPELVAQRDASRARAQVLREERASGKATAISSSGASSGSATSHLTSFSAWCGSARAAAIRPSVQGGRWPVPDHAGHGAAPMAPTRRN